MDTITGNISNSPKGIRGDRNYKALEYQIVKVLRAIALGFGLVFKSIAVLVRDVAKGIFGK